MSKEDVKAIPEWIAEALRSEFEGRIEESVRLADQAYAAAQQAGERALQIQALVQQARALDCRQTAPARVAAEKLYRQALRIAIEDDDAVQIAVIWRRLALLAIRMDHKTTQALEHWKNHSAAIAALPSGDLEHARNHHLRSEIHYRNAEYKEAESRATSAIDSVLTASEQGKPLASAQLLDLSRYRVALAKSLEAQGLLDRAVDIYKQEQKTANGSLKLSRADMVTLLMNYGLALKKKDSLRLARTTLETALRTMLEDATPTLDAGIIHTFLSDLSYSEPGKAEEAARHGYEAREIYGEVGAPDHRKAEACTNIANAAMKRKDFGAAQKWYLKALDLRQSVLDDNHYQVGVNKGSLAEALLELESYADAEKHVNEARQILEGGGHNEEALQWIKRVHARVLEGLQMRRASGGPSSPS